MMDKNSRDLAFTVFNAGIVDKDIDFEVSVDGNVISTFTMNIPAQKATPIVRESLFTSLATGTHTIRIEAKTKAIPIRAIMYPSSNASCSLLR